jgi:hypothetical protein
VSTERKDVSEKLWNSGRIVLCNIRDGFYLPNTGKADCDEDNDDYDDDDYYYYYYYVLPKRQNPSARLHVVTVRILVSALNKIISLLTLTSAHNWLI